VDQALFGLIFWNDGFFSVFLIVKQNVTLDSRNVVYFGRIGGVFDANWGANQLLEFLKPFFYGGCFKNVVLYPPPRGSGARTVRDIVLGMGRKFLRAYLVVWG
jgi:hypothetical protein